MIVLGIICLVVSVCYFGNACSQEYVTHQTAALLGWLGFGLAGMSFFVLEKLNQLISLLKEQKTIKSVKQDIKK